MPATLRSGRSSSRPLVMYAGRPKAASPSPIRETTGPSPPSAAVGMRIGLRWSLTMATTVPAAQPAAYARDLAVPHARQQIADHLVLAAPGHRGAFTLVCGWCHGGFSPL